MARWRVGLGEDGKLEAEVDGVSVAEELTGLSFSAGPDGGAVLWLQLKPGALSIAGEGVVHTTEPVADWLDAVDVEELDASVLERAGWGTGSLTTLCLEILKERATHGA